jgi:hypothetical protein
MRSQHTLKQRIKHVVVYHLAMSRFSLILKQIQHRHLDQRLETPIGS